MIKFTLYDQWSNIEKGDCLVLEQYDGRWTMYRFEDHSPPDAVPLPENWIVA